MNEQKIDIKDKLAAIQKIVETLESFPAQDTKDIVSFALKQLNLDEDVEQLSNTTAGNVSGGQSQVSEDVYDFVKEKAPKNEYQRVAVLAFFLERKRNMESFNAKDIVDANTDARQPRFSNISTTMNRASTIYKYINSVKRGVYMLSADGIELVEALPDQSAIPKLSGKKTSVKRRK